MEIKTLYLYDDGGYYNGLYVLVPGETAPENSTEVPMDLEAKNHYLIHWNSKSWEYVENENDPEPKTGPEPELTLDEIKENKIMDLKFTRDAKEVEPVSTDKGIFDYDDKSRDRLFIARQALEDSTPDGNIVWTTADNQRVSLGVKDFANINLMAASRSNELHIKYNQLKEAVLVCESKEEVEMINWEMRD